jgi:hypothetical protein
MGAPAGTKEKGQEALSSKTKVIVFGLVLAIIGSVISSSYAKATMTNYTGFGMLLAGITVFVFGICATATATVKTGLTQGAPPSIRVNRPKTLCLSIWAIGVGMVLSIIGSLLGGTYAKNTIINDTGFGMLLTGICFFVLGIFGSLLGTLQTQLIKNKEQSGIKPKVLFYSILSVGIGIVLTVIGSIVAGSYAKETIMNYTGFGTLLVGIAVLSLGMSGTAVTILKSSWGLNGKRRDSKPRITLGSIWAIGIGSMLLVTGSLIAASYAKNSLMNYSGFAMLLAGTGVFVYGVFETARFSTMGYLSGKWTGSAEPKEKFPNQLRNFWRNIVKTSAIINLAGVMVAICLLFFSLWQLDLIVSGPVWWSSLPHGQGTGWSHLSGAYSSDYFQCFLWKTTIGQAYDTLFTLIFISFILLFASAFFWPHSRMKNDDLTLRANHRNHSRNSKTKPRRTRDQKNQPPAPETPSTSQEGGAGGGT